MPLQLLLRILASRRQQIALAASHGDPHSDLAATKAGKPGLVGGHVIGQLGDEQVSGDPDRRLGVVLLEHPADELCGCERLHLLDDETVTTDDTSTADVKDLHGSGELVFGDREGVKVFRSVGHHLLALDREADRGQTVTQARRPLELELGRRLSHLGLEAVDDRLGIAVEELHQLRHELAVLRGLGRADAGARAPLDVKQQAGSPEELVAPELCIRASPDRERPEQQVEGLADRVRVRVGPKYRVSLRFAPRMTVALGHWSPTVTARYG